MVKSATLRLAVITAALLCVVALAFASCGGRGHRWSGGQPEGLANPPTADSPPDGGLQSTDSALAELDALGCPESVDAALWAELKEALAAGLTTDNQLPTTRFASTPPTGEANRVNDLSIADNGDGTFTLSWHYRNLGDYDQNGTVGISDITPIAMHFGEAVREEDVNRNSIQAVIDGSGNGVVDIADITAIAANFQTEFSGYMVERSPSPAEKYAEIATLALADAAGDGAKCFSHLIPFARRALYRVTPEGFLGEPGGPSEPVELLLEGGEWRMHGKDARHTMRTPYVGPQASNVISSAEGESTFSWNSVVSSDGVAYVMQYGTWNGLSAIDRHGAVRWVFAVTDQRMSEYSSPAIGVDGTVYFTSTTHLMAVNPDGTLKWDTELPEICYFSSPTIAADGTVYVGTGDGYYDTQDGYLLAFNSDGVLTWSYFAGEDIVPTAAVGEDGTVCSATYEGTVFALNPDGSLKWELQVEESGAVWSSPAIGDDGTVYVGIQGGKFTDPPDWDCGYIYAISPDGSVKWEITTEGWISSCPAIGDNGVVYAGSVAGYLYAINPDGAVQWRFTTDASVLGNSAIGGDGLVYVAPTSGTVYALTADGEVKWSQAVSSGTEYGGNPVLGEDGLLYVGLGSHYYVLGDGI